MNNSNTFQKEIKRLKNQLTSLKELYSDYNSLATAFGKSGIPKDIISHDIPEIENETNKILGLLTDNAMSVKYETEKESAKGKKKVARLAYTYAGHEVGSVDIVKTGAKVKDNYYVNTDSGQKKNERVIRIDPAWLIVAGVVIVAAVVLLFLAKRAYDNFYVIRHQRKMKKNDKMRFREKKRKKYNRRKDRFF